MGWAAGFQAGTNMARGWLDTYQQAKDRAASEEMANLNPQAQVAQGQGLQITAPDGTTSTAVVDPRTGGDINAITKQYTDAGYKVTPLSAPQYISRSGSLDTGVATGSQADALNSAGNFNVDHLNQMAQIYAKYGEPDKAAALTAQAAQLQRQNMADYRTNTDFDRKQAMDADIAAANGDPAKVQAALAKYDPLQAAQYNMYNSQGRSAAVAAKRQEQIQGVIDQSHDWLTRLDGSKDDQMGVYGEMADMYNKDHRYQDGITASVHAGSDGKPILVRADSNGKVLGADALTPSLARNYVMQHQRYALSMLDPQYDQHQQQIDNTKSYQDANLALGNKNADNENWYRHQMVGLEGQKVGLERTRNSALMNAYGRPQIMPDGQGGYVSVGVDKRTGGLSVNKLTYPDGTPVTAARVAAPLSVQDRIRVDEAIKADPDYIKAAKRSPEAGQLMYNQKYQQLTGQAGAPGQTSGLDLRGAASGIQKDTGKRPAASAAPSAPPTRGLIPWMQANGIHPVDAMMGVLPGASANAESNEDNRF